MANADYFLKLGSMKGESHDDSYKDYIELLSFSHGSTQAGSGGFAGGSGTGKVNVQDLHFTHHMDSASPEIFKAVTSGEHIGEGVVIARKAGGKQEVYLKITMTDVMVSSQQWGAHSGETLPAENVTLNFSKIKFEYFKQDEKGKTVPINAVTYDIKANKVS